MSAEHVLAAAASLRRFSMDEIAAFCDEQPRSIAEILSAAAPAVERVDPDRWRVADVGALRRALRSTRTTSPVAADPDISEARLELAERTLVDCAAEPSAGRRRTMIFTATNHLRQVLARRIPDRPEWWTVDLAGDGVRQALTQQLDPAESLRLQLDVAVARLAEGNSSGRLTPTGELIDAVAHFRREVPQHGGSGLNGVVQGFVDLVTAQLTPTTAPAVDRLLVALARRRIRGQVEVDAVGALRDLEPLVRILGGVTGRTPVHDLYQTVAHLPDGRGQAVVYADLLQLLPRGSGWQLRGAALPGALVEVVAEQSAIDLLSRSAGELAADLRRSDFASDAALIGQAAHVFQDLAERGSAADSEMISRGDRTRSELIALARSPGWPAPAASGGDRP